MKLTCIMCPMGCALEVRKTKDGYSVTGNNCARGEAFGKEEMVAPKRILTALVHTNNGVAAVKTDRPIDKNKINAVMKELDKVFLKNAKVGQIVIENVCKTGANIVITKIN